MANGKIIASEAFSGTDKMLKDIILRKIRFQNEGVLVKLAKPIQDRRVDLPAIGMRTIQLIKEIGLSGIALEEKSSFISEKEKVIEFANKNNIFIFGISNEKLNSPNIYIVAGSPSGDILGDQLIKTLQVKV